VSTILKALKKLEQETQAAVAAGQLPPQKGNTMAGSAPKGNRRLWLGIGVGSGLLSMGLGLTLFLLWRSPEPPAPPRPKGHAIPAPPPETAPKKGSKLPIPEVFPPRQPGDLPPTNSTAQRRTKPEAKKKTAQAAAPKATTPKADAKPAGATVTATADPAAKKNPARTPTPSPPAAQPSGATKATKPPKAAAAAKTQAPADPYAKVPSLEANSPIDLQAISWAENADRCIAVINNTVLHEGDSVEGYTVVKIRPDDVVLQREERMWRASFIIR
jgi:hypothetical protein